MPAPTAPELTTTTLRPVVEELMDFFGQGRDPLFVQRPIGRGQHARADLDDHDVSRGGNFLTQ